MLENRLICPHTEDKAAFTTTLSFLPMFRARSVKTGEVYSEAVQAKVKTEC